jgi:hypothetical protein
MKRNIKKAAETLCGFSIIPSLLTLTYAITVAISTLTPGPMDDEIATFWT